jgi:hypothetical protein
MNAARLTVNGLRVLCMRRCVTRAVRIAYKPAEIEPVIVRNFSPALPRLVQRDDIVEALSSRVPEQVRFLYSAPAKASRSSLGL